VITAPPPSWRRFPSCPPWRPDVRDTLGILGVAAGARILLLAVPPGARPWAPGRL